MVKEKGTGHLGRGQVRNNRDESRTRSQRKGKESRLREQGAWEGKRVKKPGAVHTPRGQDQ